MRMPTTATTRRPEPNPCISRAAHANWCAPATSGLADRARRKRQWASVQRDGASSLARCAQRSSVHQSPARLPVPGRVVALRLIGSGRCAGPAGYSQCPRRSEPAPRYDNLRPLRERARPRGDRCSASNAIRMWRVLAELSARAEHRGLASFWVSKPSVAVLRAPIVGSVHGAHGGPLLHATLPQGRAEASG
jgi:hypothetical protein